MRVRIVVDSTADIPPERARELEITVIPLLVLFGDESYRDGVDIDAPTFYRRLTTSSAMPTTATPPPLDYERAYRALIERGATGILALHIASQFSGSYSSSRTAADEVSRATGTPIEVLDTGNVSGGYGLVAEMVAREACEGASLAQLKARAMELMARVKVFAVIDTLEYLRRGGRIGRMQAMLGTAFKVKPLLEVRDGQLLPLEKVRTRGKAVERIGQLISEQQPLEAVAVEASDVATAAELEAVVRVFWDGPIEHFGLGPVVGTHAGPAAGGVIAIRQARD